MNASATVRVVALMVIVGGASAALHAWVNSRTAARIEANEHAYAMRQLNQIIPQGAYDNALANDYILVRDEELLGGAQLRAIYRAYRDGKPLAAVIETVAPNGYSGNIGLLVGVYADGRVAAVRVTAHRETPGLGDRIDVRRGDWIHIFEGSRIGEPPLAGWAVRKDGGQFDQFTGATVTPRAVVTAVRDALLYFDTHSDDIFSAPAHSPNP